MVICQNCGSEVKDEARFCNNCGSEIIREEVVAEEVKTMYCANCGFEWIKTSNIVLNVVHQLQILQNQQIIV